MPGPIPKRTDQRRRRNKPQGVQVASAPAGPTAKRPNVSPDWHPLAKDWFRSLGESGQSQFFESSDWQSARFTAEIMTRALNQGQRVSSQLVVAILSAQGNLLTTEGDRRRHRIELERGDATAQPAQIAIMGSYRDAAATAK